MCDVIIVKLEMIGFLLIFLLNISFNFINCQNTLSPLNASDLIYLESVKFGFFNYRRNSYRPHVIRWNTSMSFNEIRYFEPRFKTIIIIHGFADGIRGSYMIPLLMRAYHRRGLYNIVAVDWSELCRAPYYATAARYTYHVGLKLADFLEALSREKGLDLKKTELVGFSLGAHIAGVASSIVEVSRVIGLDPSEVFFTETPPKYRLDSTDAPIVEVLHTTGGVIGFARPIGTRDWYPNGGMYPQPGCSIADPMCSHSRAYKYFAEAVKNRGRGWRGVSCNSYDGFLRQTCLNGTQLALGNDNTDDRIKGTFFLRTNLIQPYGRDANDI